MFCTMIFNSGEPKTKLSNFDKRKKIEDIQGMYLNEPLKRQKTEKSDHVTNSIIIFTLEFIIIYVISLW